MAGVINLRGSVVPVVDLRLCFEMSKTESTRNTCIVVVEVLLDNESTVIGALADSVEEVIDLEPEQIEPAPRIGTHIRTDFIKGMGKRDTQFIMILDIDRVFSAEELAAVRAPGIQQGPRGSSRVRGRNGAGSLRPISHYASVTKNHLVPGLCAPPRARLRRGRASTWVREEDDARGAHQAAIERSRDLTPTAEYCDYLFSGEGLKDEFVHLIDVVTTNKTDFFREPRHFEFLIATAFPNSWPRASARRPTAGLERGCSTGEEPYTLAMVLSEYADASGLRLSAFWPPTSRPPCSRKQGSGSIQAEAGRAGAGRTLQANTSCAAASASLDRVRVVPELRRLVEFRRLNFMDSTTDWRRKPDVIFCRNVIIYFDRPTQESILQKLSRHLRARRLFVRRPRRDAARHGFAPDAVAPAPTGGAMAGA